MHKTAAVGPDRHRWLLGPSTHQPAAAHGPRAHDASASAVVVIKDLDSAVVVIRDLDNNAVDVEDIAVADPYCSLVNSTLLLC